MLSVVSYTLATSTFQVAIISARALFQVNLQVGAFTHFNTTSAYIVSAGYCTLSNTQKRCGKVIAEPSSVTSYEGTCMDRKVLLASRAVSRRLVKLGAEAVVLFGSRVRGDAYKESDIDIHAIGKGPSYRYRLERYQGFLVSICWMTSAQHHRAFESPSEAGGMVPAWRNAMIIYDPHGIADSLKQEAKRWRWQLLDKKADRWVAEEVTSYAEEVHRLIGNLQLGRRSAAAVMRSVLAIRMAPILAVHCRILYDTENQLWNLVSTKVGTEWAQLQSAALGEGNQTFEETCKAALQLYAFAAREVKHLLNRRQYQVVAHACEIAGHPIKD